MNETSRRIFSASDPMTRQCPNLGRYEIVSLFRPPNADSVEDILAVDGEQNVANVAEVHDVRVPSTPFPKQCHHGSVRRLDIGCRTPDRMEFATSCSDEALGKDCSLPPSSLAFRQQILVTFRIRVVSISILREVARRSRAHALRLIL